ncbi:MAG: hypothetical protein QNL04_00380 [SAR324 cluster bacterium]|nr:hypothetical protein [SAR324 cluster bacterium]
MFIKQLNKTAALVALIAMASCGMKTPPRPYASDEFGSAVQNYQVHFRGNGLHIAALLPEVNRVIAVKLVVEQISEDCPQCRDATQSMVFSLKDGFIFEKGGSLTQRTLAKQIKWQLRPSFDVIFPKDFFPPLKGQVSFKISLVGRNGEAGFTPALAPIQPKALQNPVIKVQPIENGQFLATWEGATPVFGDDIFSDSGFGVNFYLAGPEGEVKLNQFPLRIGYFNLPRGRITAFSVDKFGNESGGIKLLQESLAPTP